MFYEELATELGNGAVVVATIVCSQGSVPREVGAKMLISSERCIDTIGGGAGEAKVIQQAVKVLQTGEKQLVEIDLTGSANRNTEGICGGKMMVWLERWQGKEALSLANQILMELQSGQSVRLVTPYGEEFPYISTEPIDPILINAFVEVLQPSPLLLIVGAGHVGEQLAKVAHLIGFQIAIQDDRIEWANPDRYPQAKAIYLQLDHALAQLSTHRQLYAALVTRSYKYDLNALTALLNRDVPCTYIGMIGSDRRVRQVYEQVEQTGISAAKLQKIYAPIGLDIGAQTPSEIAVSICAELVLVRRGDDSKSLADIQPHRNAIA